MEYPLNQSAWRRGWNDTKTAWTSWYFYVLDAVVAVAIGGIFEWYWGLVALLFGMFCVWIGATATAPIKQRNEARQIIEESEKPKPVPLPNRQELFTAIHHLQDTARETILRHDVMKNRRDIGVSNYQQETDDYNTAYMAYWEAEKQLDTQASIAGKPFQKTLTNFKNTVKLHVYSRELPNVPEYSEIMTKLGEAVQDAEFDIDAISQ